MSVSFKYVLNILIHNIINTLIGKIVSTYRSIGKRRLAVEKYFGVRKEKAAVRTIASHIKNMIVGKVKFLHIFESVGNVF